jgi:hypothetical protein
MAITSGPQLECLLLASSNIHSPIPNVIREVVVHAGMRFTLPRKKETDVPGRLGPPEILENIMRADLIVADISQANANVFYEVGLAHANGKPVLLLVEEPVTPQSLTILGAAYLPYERTKTGLARLQRLFRETLELFKKSPRHFASSFFPPKPAPVSVIDLDKLEPREFENLCFELLSQIGFRRVEWGKELQGVDAVATLKKKDPDGFEYQELWLISMGLHAPVDSFIELASDPELLYRKILGRPEFREMTFGSANPVTLLLISVHETQTELFERDSRWLERRFRGRRFNYRTRIWNTEHLVNLVQQYPQLAEKYFSEKGRAQSRYRKRSVSTSLRQVAA